MTRVQQRVGSVSERHGLRYVLLGVAVVAAAVGVATFLLGTLEWTVGETRLFRNSHVGRPLAVATLMALVAGRGALAARLLWPVALMAATVPVNGYENIWKRTLVEEHPLRSARECLSRVQRAERAAGRPGPGVYSIGEHRWFLHSYYYYFRDLGWEAVDEIQQPALDAAILEVGRQRPVMIDDRAFLSARSRYRDVNVAMLRFSTALLLLPGPYGACDTSAPAASR